MFSQAEEKGSFTTARMKIDQECLARTALCQECREMRGNGGRSRPTLGPEESQHLTADGCMLVSFTYTHTCDRFPQLLRTHRFDEVLAAATAHAFDNQVGLGLRRDSEQGGARQSLVNSFCRNACFCAVSIEVDQADIWPGWLRPREAGVFLSKIALHLSLQPKKRGSFHKLPQRRSRFGIQTDCNEREPFSRGRALGERNSRALISVHGHGSCLGVVC